MSRYFGRVMRALIVSCLGFGGGIGLLVMIVFLVFKGDAHAFQYGINAGLAIGSVFAVLLLGVLLPMDLTAHMFAGKNYHAEIWELEQRRDIELKGSLPEVITRCRLALLSVPYVMAVSDDVAKSTITAKIGSSWRSSGEAMRVKIEPKTGSDKSWCVTCTSRSESDTVLFDYAKNCDNVESWLNNLEKPNPA